MSAAADGTRPSAPAPDVFDSVSLLRDLGLGVDYACRMGLVGGQSALHATLCRARQSLSSGQATDVGLLLSATSEVAQVIAPVTLGDLRNGRDPASAHNQTRSRRISMLLAWSALAVVLLIAYLMHALSLEQATVKAIVDLQERRPQQMLTDLRRLVQLERPTLGDSPSAYAAYRQRLNEFQALNQRAQALYGEAAQLALLPVIPLGPGDLLDFLGRAKEPPASRSPALPVAGPAAEATGVAPTLASTDASTVAAGAAVSDVYGGMADPAFDECVADSRQQFPLPPSARHVPDYMQQSILDSVHDYCFRQKVLSAGAQFGSAAVDETVVLLGNLLPTFKRKVTLRAEWFLPLLFGVLGSAVFLIRNITNPRLPVQDGPAVVSRLLLGGVAALVMGWFTVPSGAQPLLPTALTFPLALAFITGYGIEIVFGLLDRLSRAVGAMDVKSKGQPLPDSR